MDSDTRQILEAYQKPGGKDWEDLDSLRTRAAALESALKTCLKHFESEPTDPGHPELIKVAKQALAVQ